MIWKMIFSVAKYIKEEYTPKAAEMQMIPNENKEKNGASRRICSPDAASPVFGHRIRRKIKRTGRYPRHARRLQTNFFINQR